jgi:NAD(P)-dependent dehydrogenase (short-subunit alcohol dehydrogenase family)
MSGTALVTGGGRGIGRAIARVLTREGYQVAITGRTPTSLEEAVAAGDAALALPGDASARADVDEAVRRTESELGPLDLVVANAGRFSAAGPIWESDPDDWWRDAEVNLRGPQLALWAALQTMVPRGSGRIVVLGSGIGAEDAPYASAYSASKAAVMRLVESVSGEVEDTPISLFVISPGLVATDMTQFPETFLAHYPDWRDRAQREGVPPERAAQMVVALASGKYDVLSGRFLPSTTDLDAAAAAVGETTGTLRVVPWATE